jgi:3-phosphoshikimate 1-carboxyvinyltransferase
VNANITFNIRPGGALRGEIAIPGDKSISHRFVMLAALAQGESFARGFLEGADALATVAAFRAMGVSIDGPHNSELRIAGVGLHGLAAPGAALDMGNSGTAMRLMAGILSGQQFDSSMVGDESLSQRPMRRITEPLAQMGARITTEADGTPPLHIAGAGSALRTIDYAMPVASAQVKSSILLAGLYAHGAVTVHEPAPTRDHSERMLGAFGKQVEVTNGRVSITGGGELQAQQVVIPADISSAAFFLVGGSIVPKSRLLLRGVGLNPTRTGAVDILRAMGADITVHDERLEGGEPVADLEVAYAALRGISIAPELVPLAIDELPVLMVAAACAMGQTVLRGAKELRVKESDRIATTVAGLRSLGVEVEEFDDGMCVQGGSLAGGTVDSHGDHRIAMAFAMAAMASSGAVRIQDCANVDTSFPNFASLCASAGMDIEVAG